MTRRTGRLKLSGLGPCFYVESEFDVPPAVQDVVLSGATTGLHNKFEDHDREVTIEHVKPRVKMGTVSWDPDVRHPDKTVEIEIDDLSMEWYSQTPFEYDEHELQA